VFMRDARIFTFPLKRNRRGIPQKAEGKLVARSDFPGKLSRRHGMCPADEKVVRERLHITYMASGHLPLAWWRKCKNPRHSANAIKAERVGLIYDDDAYCAGQLSGPGWP